MPIGIQAKPHPSIGEGARAVLSPLCTELRLQPRRRVEYLFPRGPNQRAKEGWDDADERSKQSSFCRHVGRSVTVDIGVSEEFRHATTFLTDGRRKESFHWFKVALDGTVGAEGHVMPRFSSHSYFPISRVPQWRCKLGAALKDPVRPRPSPPRTAAAIIIPPVVRSSVFDRDRRAVMHNRGVKKSRD